MKKCEGALRAVNFKTLIRALCHRLHSSLDLQEETFLTMDFCLFDLQDKLRRPVSIERARGALCRQGCVILALLAPAVLQGHP